MIVGVRKLVDPHSIARRKPAQGRDDALLVLAPSQGPRSRRTRRTQHDVESPAKVDGARELASAETNVAAVLLARGLAPKAPKERELRTHRANVGPQRAFASRNGKWLSETLGVRHHARFHVSPGSERRRGQCLRASRVARPCPLASEFGDRGGVIGSRSRVRISVQDRASRRQDRTGTRTGAGLRG
jgi:hypothetical protein